MDDITRASKKKEAERIRELDKRVMERAKHLTTGMREVKFPDGAVMTLSDPEYVGKLPEGFGGGCTPFGVERVGRVTEHEVRITSPKMYSWIIAEGNSTNFSEPIKYDDLKQGDVVYVETLVGIVEMKVEVGKLGIIVVSEKGSVGRVQRDDDGYAGCSSVMTKSFLDWAMKKTD